MKQFYTFAIAIIVAFSSCSKTATKTDLETRNLKDSVSNIITLSFDAVDKFGEGIVTKGKLRSFIEEATFDSSGYLLSECTHYIKENTPSMFEEFDLKGYRTKQILFDDYGKPKYTDVYVNDENGNVLSETDQDGDITRISYVFDNRGNIIKRKEKGPYWEYTNTYVYDDYGNCIEEKSTMLDGSTIFYKYNDKHQLIGYKHISSDPKYSAEVEISYDQFGCQIEWNNYSLENPQQKKLTSKVKRQYYGSSKLNKLLQSWNEKGEIEDNSSFYYAMFNDTIPEISITKNKDGIFSYLTINTFHNNLNVAESKSYDLSSEEWISHSYKYINGKISSMIMSYDGKTSNILSFVYNGDKLKEIKQTVGDSCIITEYTRTGLPAKEIYYDKNGQELKVITYNYSGDCLTGSGTSEWVVKDKKHNKEYTGKNVYENGLLSETVRQENGITVVSKTVYDERKNIIKLIENSDITEYQYKFDKQGNWIEQCVIVNGKPDQINVRMIQYYNN